MAGGRSRGLYLIENRGCITRTEVDGHFATYGHFEARRAISRQSGIPTSGPTRIPTAQKPPLHHWRLVSNRVKATGAVVTNLYLSCSLYR